MLAGDPPRVRPTVETLRGRRRLHEPSLRLVLAMLDDALEIVLEGTVVGGQRRWLETVEWVLSEDTSWLFSFCNVCDLLDLDPAKLRTTLLPWLEVRPAAIGAARAPLQSSRGMTRVCSGEVVHGCESALVTDSPRSCGEPVTLHTLGIGEAVQGQELRGGLPADAGEAGYRVVEKGSAAEEIALHRRRWLLLTLRDTDGPDLDGVTLVRCVREVNPQACGRAGSPAVPQDTEAWDARGVA